MCDDLLETARQQAQKADLSVRVAALLRIARAQSTSNVVSARNTLLEATELAGKMPARERSQLLLEARQVAAAVDPSMLHSLPADPYPLAGRFEQGNIVGIMLTNGHIDAAFDYVVQHDDPASFPLFYVANVLHHLDPANTGSAARRKVILDRVVEIWRRRAGTHFNHQQDHFVRLFGLFWKEFSKPEALAIANEIVAEAALQPDDGIHAGYNNEVNFTSLRQNTLFQILHVLRHLDPALARSLVDSHDQLAVAVRRYPDGLDTIHEEAKAESERRKAEGATCGGGGYALVGDPRDFPRQRRLIDAGRSGDFEPSIEDAIEKYREDVETPNYAPKGYWPSSGAFRTLLYEAGKRLGPAAASLLERVPDDDLRLFATIELAAALAGVTPATITRMKQPRSLETRSVGNSSR